MGIDNDIQELLKAGVITSETAERIKNHYGSKSGSTANRLFVVFGILGAMLVGLGIVLIIAHNWDGFSRTTKTIFSFLPLAIAQLLSFYVLLKKPKSTAWRESVSVLLFFAVGACIAMIGQVYNIPGNLSSFLLSWMILCLPILYIMNSSATAILYLLGITYYAAETSYFSYPSSHSYWYWALLLAIIPYYYFLWKRHPTSNFVTILNWVLPLSVTIALGTLGNEAGIFLFIGYCSIFGFFYNLGSHEFFKGQVLRNNSYQIIGTIGTLILLFITSFEEFWSELRARKYTFGEIFTSLEFWAAIAITVGALVFLYIQQRHKSLTTISFLSFVFILFFIIFGIGLYASVSVVLINVLILAIGVWTIVNGTKKDHFGILNFGLSIITLWILIRFLNSDLSFVVRGFLLMAIGLAFFAANYWMYKKRKKNE